MNQTATQIINITPIRISAEHYQTPSFTGTGKTYNQHFDYDLKHWTCTCPNYTIQKNPNCKHIILLRAYIKQASQEPAPEKQHSSSIELVQVLTRISNLEHGQDATDTAFERQQYQHEIKADQIATLQAKLGGYEHAITRQQKQIDQLMHLVKQQAENIENNRANHYAVIKEIDQEVRQHAETIKQQQRTIDDQAQQIDALHEQISSQPRSAEQVVRVVIEQQAPATRAVRQQSDEPRAMEIKEIRENGKLVACKVGKFTVKVIGSCAGNCDCSTGLMDRQCPHMVKVDQFLSK